MRRANADLLGGAALAILGALVVVAIPSSAVRVLFALPLLFFLPGFAVTAALFPAARLDRARRLLLQLGSSLAISVLAALLLELTSLGLSRDSWALLLALVTCAASAVAIRRRKGPWRAPRVPRLSLTEAAIFGFAVALAVGTLAFARSPLAAKNVRGYTALSISAGRGQKSNVLHVQISSSELRPLGYRLELEAGKKLVDVQRVALVPGQQWRLTVHMTPKETSDAIRIRALLYRTDHPHAVYRAVWLTAASA